jgi:hypothetical protein
LDILESYWLRTYHWICGTEPEPIPFHLTINGQVCNTHDEAQQAFYHMLYPPPISHAA